MTTKEAQRLYQRITPDEILRAHGSPSNALDAGNYALAALTARDDLTRGRALVLAGLVEAGLALLEDQDTPEALLTRAFGLWAQDRDEAALAVLNDLRDHEQATRFRCLLERDRIRVLTLQKELDFKTVADDRFQVVTMGFGGQEDIVIRLGQSEWVDDALNQHADLFFLFRPEYLPFPGELDALACPKTAFITDFDLHLYQKYDDFKRFDYAMVYGPVEHDECSQLFGMPVATTLWFRDPPELAGTRDTPNYDIVLTGNSFHPFFSEKSRLSGLFAMLDPALRIRIHNGFLSMPAYQHLIRQAHLVPTYVRFYGSFPTRGLETHAVGSGVLYQKGGCLSLYCQDRIHPYTPETLESDLYHALTQQSETTPSAQSVQQNSVDPVRLLLKQAVFQALVQHSPRSVGHANPRPLFLVGPGGHGSMVPHPSPERDASHVATLIDYNHTLPDTSASRLASATCHTYLSLSPHLDAVTRADHLQAAQTLLRRCIADGPVPLFNLARLYFYDGDYQQARPLFQRVLTTPFKESPLRADLFSALLFHPEDFPYRAYIDNLVQQSLARPVRFSPEAILQSGAHTYLALIAAAQDNEERVLECVSRALTLFPENVRALRLALDQEIARMNRNPEPAICRQVHRRFNSLVAVYPYFVHPYAIPTLEALAHHPETEQTEMTGLATRWFLFYTRVQENEWVLPLSREQIASLLQLTTALPDALRTSLEKIAAFVDGDCQIELNDFEEEVAFCIFRDREEARTYHQLVHADRVRVGSPKVLLGLGHFFAEAGDDPLTLHYYSAYLNAMSAETFIPEIDRIYNLASRRKAAGDAAFAERLFLIVRKHDYNPAGLNFHLGELRLQQRDWHAARVHLDTCLALCPNHIRARKLRDELDDSPARFTVQEVP